jgi:hypothetical protein
MTITFSDLSDDAITDRLLAIRRGERAMLVECLRGLVELERRRTALALGYSSLFSYCVEVLGYSKASTHRRTTAARLLARFPVVAEYLTDHPARVLNQAVTSATKRVGSSAKGWWPLSSKRRKVAVGRAGRTGSHSRWGTT